MRQRFTLLLFAVAAVAAACAAPTSSPSVDQLTARAVTMYRSPTCTCCHEYQAILERAGWAVAVVEIDDTATFKARHGIPEEAWSCHTLEVDGYVVEGHVPLVAINELLERGQAIDGIALPGMPPGSPGMGGEAEGPFTVLALQGGRVVTFGSY